MNLFDISVNKFQLLDNQLYIEYSIINEEIDNYIVNCNTYDIIDNSIEKTINFYKDEARDELYTALPYEIRNLYINERYKINNCTQDPSDVNYDIFGFHKKRTILFGELRKTEYYRNYDGVNYTDLILEELRDYTRSNTGMVQYRTQTVNWYLTNNEIGISKQTIKYYTLGESIEEGIDRRTNIISETKAYTLMNLDRENSFDFLYAVKDYIQFFLDGNVDPLKDYISLTDKSYITQSIRDGMINSLRLY